jgi:hypothetical protein
MMYTKAGVMIRSTRYCHSRTSGQMMANCLHRCREALDQP